MTWVVIHYAEKTTSHNLSIQDNDANIKITRHKIYPNGLKLVKGIWFLECVNSNNDIVFYNMSNICEWRHMTPFNIPKTKLEYNIGYSDNKTKPKSDKTKTKTEYLNWSVVEDSTILNGSIEFT